jgi:hypothetical protein
MQPFKLNILPIVLPIISGNVNILVYLLSPTLISSTYPKQRIFKNQTSPGTGGSRL